MTTIGSVAAGGQSGAYRDSRGTAGRAFSAGRRVPGPHLPQCLRARLAVQRAGGRVHDPAPGDADPVSRAGDGPAVRRPRSLRSGSQAPIPSANRALNEDRKREEGPSWSR